MVETGHDAETGRQIIVLRPNASLGRRGMWLLLGLMALVMGGIGALFAAAGAWLVMPFSGLEWLLLAYCFRLSLRYSARREVITITDATVQVQRGERRPEETHEFQRAWVMLQWRKSPIRGRPSRLCLRLHGREVEVGRFLVEAEREALARELKTLLAAR